jgi:mono/diheme cytochrome c family protein
MSMSRDCAIPAAIIASLVLAAPAMSKDRIGLGRAATPGEIAAWDIDIRPNGTGLPPGRGTVAEGDALWAEKCASCHGDFGEGVGRTPAMIGGAGTLASDRPMRTVGSYWPYLSTVFDYVRRAMPYGEAQSLSAGETYALTAYILNLNDLVDGDFELSAENFGTVALPTLHERLQDEGGGRLARLGPGSDAAARTGT